MIKLDNSRKQQIQNITALSALVILTVTIVVWLLPRNERMQMRYDVGKPWMYGSLIAKFDFPIYKTDEVIEQEQDSISQSFQPYYTYLAETEKKQIQHLKNNFPQGIPGIPNEMTSVVYDRLHRLYQSGIISSPEYSDIYKDSTSMIRVVSGKTAQGIYLKSVYSTRTAYEQLLNDDKLVAYKSALQQANIIDYIEANLKVDKEKSSTELGDLLSSIPIASGMVMTGQKIIDRGEMVDEHTYRVLASLEKEVQRREASQAQITSMAIGQTIFVAIMVILFTAYLLLFRRDYFNKPRNISMLYTMTIAFPVLTSLFITHSILSVYIIPFAMGPMFIRMFMDSRTAYATHCITILICAAAVRHQYEFIIIQLVAGMVAIYSLRELTGRVQIFKTALIVVISYFAINFALQIMQSGSIADLSSDMYIHFTVNGVFLLLTYPLMYVVEKTFGFVSNVTLFELSNTNKGLLRKMSEVAPGTFQHSITVGNLASEIAHRIEADSLLVRTGALYHDIGKMENPVFFTENQVGVNPHNNMPYKTSAKIIIAHITDGVKMAEKNNLPTVIRDFILTHHGKGVVKYFYVKYKNEHPDEEVDMADFMYPGPNPFTREQAILMMADTVEAASRSLKEYTEESIKNLIERLIDEQVADGHFKECPITFRDIAIAKSVLLERLKAIYHTRISYPELKK